MILAVTGATGFVGGHLLDAALADGHRMRALTRRPQPLGDGIDWVEGALDQPEALAALVAGAEAVIHVAGVVNAPDRAAFAAGNIAGTEGLIAATTAASIARFVHVSSLAAREPALSNYGWSKAEAERAVVASSLAWDIVRPPTLYGPRDSELLELFRLAKLHVMPLPPAGGRASILHAADLTRLLLALATTEATRETYEPDDGVTNGWDHRDLARTIGAALDTRVLPLPLPKPLLKSIAGMDRLVRGARAKLTPDRVDYFCHRDWVSHRPVPPTLWTPHIATPAGLAATARWYRANGLL